MSKRRLRVTSDNKITWKDGELWRHVCGFGWSLFVSTDGMIEAAYNSREVSRDTVTRFDPAPHVAFVHGDMPPHVYADWLEEKAVKVHPRILTLLRSEVQS